MTKAELEAALDAANQEIKVLNERLSQPSDERVANLEKELATLTEENAGLVEAINELQKANKEASKKVDKDALVFEYEGKQYAFKVKSFQAGRLGVISAEDVVGSPEKFQDVIAKLVSKKSGIIYPLK